MGLPDGENAVTRSTSDRRARYGAHSQIVRRIVGSNRAADRILRYADLRLRHASIWGKPDFGLITLLKMATAARSVCAAAPGIPIIADADTGGGYALNVQRTAKDLIAAGAAGCFLEVLAVPMLTPHSYTREDVIELQCHDDLIKLSKSDTKGNKRKKSRRAKVERTSYSAARDNNTSKEKHYVNSLSGVSQGAVAKRGSNFKGNQFPVTTREAATVPPLRVPRRGFNPGGTNSENQSRSRCWIIL